MAKRRKTVRLDQRLVDSGQAATLHEAQALILAGRVSLMGQRAGKAGLAVDEAERPGVQPLEHPFVGRGGVKLAAALDHFHISVEGSTCLDIGASTGGFTDCLLQRGAAKIFAVDVGHGQLHWKLRQDPRVVNMEKVHARSLRGGMFQPEPDFFCVDVSFISARSLLPFLAPLLKAGGDWVVLVKPQFEAGRKWVEKGGLVLNPEIQERACGQVASTAEELGLNPLPPVESPLKGAEGNREFLLAGKKEI